MDKQTPDFHFLAPMSLEECRWYLKGIEEGLFMRWRIEVEFSPINSQTWGFRVFGNHYRRLPFVIEGTLQAIDAHTTQVQGMMNTNWYGRAMFILFKIIGVLSLIMGFVGVILLVFSVEAGGFLLVGAGFSGYIVMWKWVLSYSFGQQIVQLIRETLGRPLTPVDKPIPARVEDKESEYDYLP
jgi:hypothetical protein